MTGATRERRVRSDAVTTTLSMRRTEPILIAPSNRRAAFDVLERFQACRIAQGKVLDASRWFLLDRLPHDALDRRSGPSSSLNGQATGLEGSVEDGGSLAVIRGEVPIARTHREPVLLPYGWPDVDGHPKIQIGDEPLHHRCLLVIFLAEQGEMGSHDPEKFRHHRGDAGEVMRPGRSFPSARKRRHRHDGLKAFGVHRLGRRFKTDIHPFFATQRTIAGNRARILDKSSLGPNCVGFTKILTTSASHRNRAARMRERWPSCSAPIVGTNPMVTPSRRNRSLHAVMDRAVRIIFMSLGAGCKQGETHIGSRAGETGGGPQAASRPRRATG